MCYDVNFHENRLLQKSFTKRGLSKRGTLPGLYCVLKGHRQFMILSDSI